MQLRSLLGGTATGRVGFGGGFDDKRAQPPAKPPNIVFILADDLGYADVSCYGRPDFSTPDIDRIAAQGFRFLRAYSNSAVCSPTRTALITAPYHHLLPLPSMHPLLLNPYLPPPPHHPPFP